MTDNVNHPEHYEKSCSVECIDVMLMCFGKYSVLDFCQLNAFKYIWRHKNKNGLEDLKKARWYLNKALEIILTMDKESIYLEPFFDMKDYVDKAIDAMETKNE